MGFLSDVRKSLTGSGGQTTRSSTVSKPAPFTPEQDELRKIALSVGETGLENLLRSTEFQQLLFRDASFDPSRIDVAGEESAFRGVASQDELLTAELDRIRRGATPTAGQEQLINRIAEERISAGQSDIQAALRDNLRLLREELAPAAGLRPGDSPIIDRGGRLATESLRLSERLASGARGDAAQALLQFPLQSGALQSQQTQAQQGISLALQDFQNRLRSEDFQRRLAAGQLGLSLATIQPSNIGFVPPGTETTSETRGFVPSGGSGIMGGIGQGIGTLIGKS
jgi:hypothetical protein